MDNQQQIVLLEMQAVGKPQFHIVRAFTTTQKAQEYAEHVEGQKLKWLPRDGGFTAFGPETKCYWDAVNHIVDILDFAKGQGGEGNGRTCAENQRVADGKRHVG